MKKDTAGYKFCDGEFLMAMETHINARFREAVLAVSGWSRWLGSTGITRRPGRWTAALTRGVPLSTA